MVREDILGGLKSALSKGESLRQAMMSFYNAGYKKEDIEAAARALQQQKATEQFQQPMLQKQVQQAQPQKPVQKTVQPPIQMVSAYEQPKPTGKGAVIVLIVALLFLLGILVSLFLFRTEIVEFFNKFF